MQKDFAMVKLYLPSPVKVLVSVLMTLPSQLKTTPKTELYGINTTPHLIVTILTVAITLVYQVSLMFLQLYMIVKMLESSTSIKKSHAGSVFLIFMLSNYGSRFKLIFAILHFLMKSNGSQLM